MIEVTSAGVQPAAESARPPRVSSAKGGGGLGGKAARVFVANWSAMVCQLATGVVIARALGADGRGVVALVLSTATLLGGAGQLGLPSAAIFYLRSGRLTSRALLAMYLPVVAILSAMLFVLLAAAEPWFRSVILRDAAVSTLGLWVGFGALPFTMLAAYASALLLAAGEAKRYQMITATSAVSGLLMTLLLVVALHLGVAGALLAATLTQAILGAWTAAAALGQRGTMDVGTEWRLLPNFLGFGLKQHGGSLAAQIFRRADSYLLAYFLGPTSVGYYVVGSAAYEALLSVPRALAHLLHGEASARIESDASELVTRSARLLFWLMLVGVAFVDLASIPIIPILYGRSFVLAVPPLLVLAPAAVLVGFSGCLQSYFLARGKPELTSGIMITAGLLNLVLSVVLIPRAGLVGNAAATLCAAALMAILHAVVFQRLAGSEIRSLLVPRRSDLQFLRALKARVFGLRSRAPVSPA